MSYRLITFVSIVAAISAPCVFAADTDATPKTATTEHHPAPKHPHQHGKNCGHKAEKHGDHTDYEDEGHHHKQHGDHYDECTGPEADAKASEHKSEKK